MIGFVLLAMLAALGVVGLVRLARGKALLPVSPGRSTRKPLDVAKVRQVGIAVLVAVVVLAITRWPAAAIAAGVVAFVWPRLVGGGALGRRQLERVEAIAAWTESLRDTAGAASGLEQAIASTVDGAPPLLVRPLSRLVAQLQGRVPFPEALSQFAEAVGDPSADLVVAALLLNSRQSSGGLGRILTELARTSRDELEMRRTVEHQRRAVRRQAFAISIIVVAFATTQILSSNTFIHAYSSVVGQLVLAGVVVAFGFGLMRIRKLSEPDPQPRFLASVDELTVTAGNMSRAGAR